MKKATLALMLLALVACGRSDGPSRTLVQNKGSDTLVNVAQAWAEAYKIVDPNTAIAVSGGGSGTGFSALINGTVDLANASRAMKDSEVEMARQNGVDPKEWVVGYDALADCILPHGRVRRDHGDGGPVHRRGQGLQNA